MREITEVIIHTTATAPDWFQGRSVQDKVAEITVWHKARRWKTIGYHRVIDRDGSIGNGRDYSEQGAHTKGHNKGTIGIALVGGLHSNRTDKFSDNFTVKQREALWHILDSLERKFGPLKISGHNEYSSKACPGFHVGDFLQEPRKAKPQGLWALILYFLGVGK